ncbi:hypothetical protein ABIB38_004330 [Massilia sp. UYP11]
MLVVIFRCVGRRVTGRPLNGGSIMTRLASVIPMIGVASVSPVTGMASVSPMTGVASVGGRICDGGVGGAPVLVR